MLVKEFNGEVKTSLTFCSVAFNSVADANRVVSEPTASPNQACHQDVLAGWIIGGRGFSYGWLNNADDYALDVNLLFVFDMKRGMIEI